MLPPISGERVISLAGDDEFVSEEELGQASDDGNEPACNEEFEDSDIGSTRYESDGGEEVEYDMDHWRDLINYKYSDVPAGVVVDGVGSDVYAPTSVVFPDCLTPTVSTFMPLSL